MDSEVILENDNGVQIVKGEWQYEALNAKCHCGEGLMVAPMVFHADHKKGDPVMVCQDHGVHAYRFSDLVIGQQPE